MSLKLIRSINLEQAKKRIASREGSKKNKGTTLTQEQRLARREQALDDRIAVQNKMQKILSEEQFKQWRTIAQKRINRGRGKRGEGKGRRVRGKG
jgi:Spy/CpxP family protein refolding chaperone